MGESFLGLFSYCFPGNGTSKINFGRNAVTVSTTVFMKTLVPLSLTCPGAATTKSQRQWKTFWSLLVQSAPTTCFATNQRPLRYSLWSQCISMAVQILFWIKYSMYMDMGGEAFCLMIMWHQMQNLLSLVTGHWTIYGLVMILLLLYWFFLNPLIVLQCGVGQTQTKRALYCFWLDFAFFRLVLLINKLRSQNMDNEF